MKRISIYRKLMVVAGCVALVCALDVGVSFAATSTKASGDVVAPLTVTAVDPGLVFGKIIRGAALSTVSIDAALAANRQLLTGDAILAAGVTPSAAEITLSGDGTSRYTIDYDNSITLTNTTGAGAETMTVGSIVTDPPKASGGALTAGAATVYVGGTLSVAAAQVPGHYTGTFGVTIAYE